MSVILLSLIWLTSQTSPILISSLIMFPHVFLRTFIRRLITSIKALSRWQSCRKVGAEDIVTRLYIPNYTAFRTRFGQKRDFLMLKSLSPPRCLPKQGRAWAYRCRYQGYAGYGVTSRLDGGGCRHKLRLELIVELIKRFAVKWRRA